jgi:hypothetical protein
MNSDKHAVIVGLNFAGLWWIARAKFQGRPVYVIDTGNRFPLAHGIWNQVCRILYDRNIAQPITDLFPIEDIYFVQSWMPEYPDLFWKLEDRMGEDYQFDRLDALPEYGLAIKHAACQYANRKLSIVTTLKRLSSGNHRIATVAAIDRDILVWYRRYFGSDSVFQTASLIRGGFFGAATTALFVTLFAWIWIARRLRLSVSSAPAVLLGADFIRDPKATYAAADIMNSKDDVLFVFRNHEQIEEAAAWDEFEGFNGVHPDEETLSLKEGFTSALTVLVDTWRIFWVCRSMPPGVFFQAIKLPFRRITFRALFARRPVEYFLSRDDYNPEHAIRTIELRRVGAVSLGIAHGMTPPGIVDPIVRYLDFDTYFVYGRYPYPQNYVQTWSPKLHMRVVGSCGMTRDQLAQLSNPRSKDIIFFISRLVEERTLILEAIKLARAFPDRKVIVKAKYRSHNRFHMDFSKLTGDAPANLVHSWEDSYSLMLKCQYAVSNGTSSVAAEAIQFGLTTYVWDTYPSAMPYYFRTFPELCVTRCEEVIGKIHAIESGEETYPRDRFEDLIDLSGEIVYDVLRQEVGLTPRGPSEQYAIA